MFARSLLVAVARTRVPVTLAAPARALHSTAPILAAAKFPRRHQTAFMLFASDMRPTIKQEKPDISVTETMKVVAERYKNLNDADRKKYEAAAEEQKRAYEKAMAEYRAAINPRPKLMRVNAQLKAIAEARGISPTIENLASINQSLSDAEKQKLREEREAAAERIKAEQQDWDRAHAKGLQMVEELDKKLLFSKRVPEWFDIAKKRRWKAVSEFPQKYADLSPAMVDEVKAMRRQHRNYAKRLARRQLRAAGYCDEAESI